MIDGRAITKAFGRHRILDALDLRIDAGERVALLGLNGAGKTTLMRCMLGLVPFEGTLEVAGADVQTDGRAARAALGYVPQRPPHFEGTLDEVVSFYARLRGVPMSRVRDRMADLGLDLDTHGAKAVRALSGGMLQKVLLALALASEVPLAAARRAHCEPGRPGPPGLSPRDPRSRPLHDGPARISPVGGC